MAKQSQHFSWGPPDEEITGVFARGLAAVGNYAAVARDLGTQDGVVRNYEREAGRWANPIRFLRYLCDTVPDAKKWVADLFGIDMADADDPPELQRRIKILRQAYGTEADHLSAASIQAIEAVLVAQKGQ